MTGCDITIRGAGIFGLSIAWACVERGARVRLIDPAGPGAGASGGIVGALAPHVPEGWNGKKAFQFESLLMAGGFWNRVAAAGGVSPGYGRTGRLQSVADEAALALARHRAESAAELWRGLAVWEVIPAAAAGDWAPGGGSGWLIRDTLSARLHPRQACAALVAALAVRGVRVDARGEDAGKVVHATGAAGLAELSRAMDRAVGGAVKGQAALLAHDAGDAPQLFVDGLHVVPHADGTVAIGSTSERTFSAPDSTDAQVDALVAKAREAVPALTNAPVIERWAGLRPRSRSRAPMLGAHPLHEGQFIANGGFKIGFGMAPKVADLMAGLLLEGRDDIPDDFRPEASF